MSDEFDAVERDLLLVVDEPLIGEPLEIDLTAPMESTPAHAPEDDDELLETGLPLRPRASRLPRGRQVTAPAGQRPEPKSV
jgi:hypothetical protein